ncbi:MAG: 4Fe-4S dicluster domain-containing protein [Methanobrevibacter thaueri]|uniref:4Fe-4S dicluster domain-containing protein n=1 Tax=Methanobrevibacter thaueri TaxID=190975 RepID=UPI0026EA78D7|nr:4Fe-4S binding protein [Methanobrevibacter thaueri]MBE6494983.1 4Fe-4S dicluster domain-containing protein [Methanobrevibacter thaueri]
MRHRGGHSSIGLELGMHLFTEFLMSSHKSRWRIGNDIQRCTLCGRCQAVCPVNAITVSVHNKTWTLNNRRCTQCLGCVIRCPPSCLTQVKL